jgi:hypothetical protein
VLEHIHARWRADAQCACRRHRNARRLRRGDRARRQRRAWGDALTLENGALERRRDQRSERDHVADGFEPDVLISVVAVQHEHGSIPDTNRHQQHQRTRFTVEIFDQATVEALRGETRQTERLAAADNEPECARQIERDADALHLGARGARAVRVTPLGQVAVDDEQRGVLEILGCEVEKGGHDVVAAGRVEQVALRHRHRVRAHAPALAGSARAAGCQRPQIER